MAGRQEVELGKAEDKSGITNVPDKEMYEIIGDCPWLFRLILSRKVMAVGRLWGFKL